MNTKMCFHIKILINACLDAKKTLNKALQLTKTTQYLKNCKIKKVHSFFFFQFNYQAFLAIKRENGREGALWERNEKKKINLMIF
jgi:hypothetical protein